jgi:hypothetical protein
VRLLAVSMLLDGVVQGAISRVSEYDHWGVNPLVAGATALTVGACVLVHYEGLSFLSRRLARMTSYARRRVLLGIFGVLVLHVAEIWLFGLVLFALGWATPLAGSIHGILSGSILDHVYFSAMTYSTVGFGDVIPTGPLRFISGTEALTGFVLITWSASFSYLEMVRYWKRD